MGIRAFSYNRGVLLCHAMSSLKTNSGNMVDTEEDSFQPVWLVHGKSIIYAARVRTHANEVGSYKETSHGACEMAQWDKLFIPNFV